MLENKVKPLEYLLLITGYMILLFFFIFSSYKSDGMWFARSGSIGVIFGAILEYKFSHQQQLLNQEIGHRLGVWNDNPIDYSDTKAKKVVKTFTHILLVLSTVIWGYGDLLF